MPHLFVPHYLYMILLCWTFDINACLDTDINILLLQDHDVDLKWCIPFVGPCGKIIRIQHAKNNSAGTICLPTVFNTVFCFFLSYAYASIHMGNMNLLFHLFGTVFDSKSSVKQSVWIPLILTKQSFLEMLKNKNPWFVQVLKLYTYYVQILYPGKY